MTKFSQVLRLLFTDPEAKDFVFYSSVADYVTVEWEPFHSYVEQLGLAHWKNQGSFIRQLNMYQIGVSQVLRKGCVFVQINMMGLEPDTFIDYLDKIQRKKTCHEQKRNHKRLRRLWYTSKVVIGDVGVRPTDIFSSLRQYRIKC